MYANRKSQVLRQSPGLISKTDRPGPSYLTQLNAIVNQKEEPELYRALAAEPGDHAHHKVILETLDRLFDGLDQPSQEKLRDYIVNSHGMAIGNNIRNLVNMPGEIHQGGIHSWARDQGYEIDAKHNPKGLALDILEAATVPDVNYRMHVADKYMTEAVPAMNHKINQLLTDHYSNQKRFADANVLDKYNKLKAGAGVRSDSPGTSRERVLHIDSGGGDVSIGEDVLRSNGKNGNGNGKGKGNGKH